MAERRKISPRTRFEIFKRDGFSCRYCGRKSPEVILELDHIVPVAENGSDDPMNLATSCYECNSGKNAVPLGQVMTGDDPHDRAVEILEKERQLREYEEVRRAQEERKLRDWKYITDRFQFSDDDAPYIRRALDQFSVFDVAEALSIAIDRTGGRWNFIKYFCGIIRRWREERAKKSEPEARCYWCSRPLGVAPKTPILAYCGSKCWADHYDAISRGDEPTPSK
jgi:hypothetical protein